MSPSPQDSLSVALNPTCQYATFRPQRLPSPDIPVGARSVGRHCVAKNWLDNTFVINHVIVIWTRSGCGHVVMNGHAHRCPKDYLAIYLPGMRQDLRTTNSEWDYCWWSIDGPLAAALVSGFGLRAGVHRAGAPPIELIDQLLGQIVRADRAGEIDASTTALALTTAAAKAVQASPGKQGDVLVAKARLLVHDNWQHVGFGIDSIAATLGVDRSTLSRHFRKEAGVTLIQYLISMRIQNAITLLRQSDLPIAEIASRCGYGDYGYFRRVFRQRMGLSPSEFRTVGPE
jgi:AraC-like DNA-binding protein